MSSPLTLSERVGVLLATYVGIEAEQARLAATDPSGRDKAVSARVAALGEAAFALVREVEAIEDRSGNADLAATLVLLETMHIHNYAQLGSFAWDEDDRLNLQVLAALAGGTTGEVRRHTAAVLATIGVAVPDETVDPMAALISDINATWAAAQSLPDVEREPIERETLSPLWRRLWKSTPETTSIAGAAGALRYL